jgi:hypothetical protein
LNGNGHAVSDSQILRDVIVDAELIMMQNEELDIGFQRRSYLVIDVSSVQRRIEIPIV